jgi:hypothetical protein
MVMDTLTPDRLMAAGIRDGAVAQRIVEQHMSGRADHPSRIWALLVLTMWSDARRERPAQPPVRPLRTLVPAARA